jgi:uncharacterized protein
MSSLAVDIEAVDPISDVIAHLHAENGMPREALHAAVAEWDRVFPPFLTMLEDYIRDPAAHLDDADALFFFIHLCGQLRETRGYPALMRFAALDRKDVDVVLGGGVTETFHQVVASVFDGDSQLLFEVIENEKADEFIRSGLLQAMALLAWHGRIDRAEATAFLHRCFDDLRPRDDNVVWLGWQAAISYLGLSEFKELVRQAFAEGRIGEWSMKFEHFEEDLELALRSSERPERWAGDSLCYFGDVVEELSHWYCFSEEYRRRRKQEEEPVEPVGDSILEGTYINPFRNVGRNDPCPCGSGKKYKKCCLQ